MKLKAIAKKMIIAIVLITFICVLIAFIYYRSLDFLPFLFGALLGAAVSITKVFLLENAVNQALLPGRTNAGLYIVFQNLIRFALTGLALLAGALIPQLSLWGAVAGIFSYQLAVYIARFTAREDIKITEKITEDFSAVPAKESEAEAEAED